MEYSYIQKMAIVKVLLDMISVDGRIDARETHFFEDLKVKLDLSPEDHFKLREYNTLNCLAILKAMTIEQKDTFLDLMTGIILADGIIDANEQLVFDCICEFCSIAKRQISI